MIHRDSNKVVLKGCLMCVELMQTGLLSLTRLTVAADCSVVTVGEWA